KTNLSGKHNDNETAYLYSPCFDLSTLSHPMLSFSIATDIENCGDILCDRAYMEYSEDGIKWTKLGATNEGTNWYNDANHQVWNEQDNVRWRVASISLPSSASLKLRFVFRSDPGASREGIAIDDIHIFDLEYPIYDEETRYDASSVNDENGIFLAGDEKIIGQLLSYNQPAETVTNTAYFHRSPYSVLYKHYFLTRNYAVQSSALPHENEKLRLFVTDAEVMQMIADNHCPECEKA